MPAMNRGVSAGNHVYDNECIEDVPFPCTWTIGMMSELENATPPPITPGTVCTYNKREGNGA